MNRVVINIDALRHNLTTIEQWVSDHGGSLTVVTKALCGSRPVIENLQALGARSLADSRIRNLAAYDRTQPNIETWYLRPAHISAVPEIVALADISLNSEISAVKALDAEARRQGCQHQIVIMVELGDLREGVLPGMLLDFYAETQAFANIRVIGIGANLGCLSGAIPGIDQLAQLGLYRELIELKFGTTLPIVSAGTSATLPLLREGKIPRQINHFRVGESIFLGTDLLHGGTLEGLRDDVATLEAEVIEIKEKSLTPTGEIADISPFTQTDAETAEIAPGQRGYRALVTVGHVDTDVNSLAPVDPGHRIAGATSDITVLNLDNPQDLAIGDVIGFKLQYAALARLMGNPYTTVIIKNDARESAAHLLLPQANDTGRRLSLARTPLERASRERYCLR